MTGVLLVNMGGPQSSTQMRRFLKRMFKDPFILPYNRFTRFLLAWLISITRYRKSWKKYRLIGGTPIPKATKQTAEKLQLRLGSRYKVTMAFSYSSPLIRKSRSFFKKEGIKNIIVIPLYPQSSYTTTHSVKADVEKVFTDEKGYSIHFIKEFYHHEFFIKFWSELISAHIRSNNIKSPFLLFSAHSIPTYLIDKGDTYSWAIAESSSLIAKNLGLAYDYAWQSGMKRGEWLAPDTKDKLRELKESVDSEIVMIPISFINENLETLYDLDHDIIPYAKNVLGIKNISRVRIPEASETFIELLADLVKQHA